MGSRAKGNKLERQYRGDEASREAGPERRDRAMEGTESNYQWYVGIDWGAERYEVCVLDRQARRSGSYNVPAFSIAISTASQRSATPRVARP